jgi:hypothetical protein
VHFDLPAKPFVVCKAHPDSEKNPSKYHKLLAR